MAASCATTCSGSRLCRLAAIGLLAAGLAGCVIVPTVTTPIRHIPSQQIAALQVGEHTRTEILMRYGNPDLRLEDDRVLVYQWRRMRAVVVAGYFGDAISDLEALFLEFDDRGVLVRTGSSVAWRYKTIAEQAQEWARGSSLAH